MNEWFIEKLEVMVELFTGFDETMRNILVVSVIVKKERVLFRWWRTGNRVSDKNCIRG